MKTLGLFAAGILVGIIAMMALNFGADEDAVAPGDDAMPLTGNLEDRFDAFRRDVDARLAALEQQIGQLGEGLAAAAAGGRLGGPVPAARTAEQTAALQARTEELRARLASASRSDADRLRDAGFTEDRIAWAEQRIGQVQVEVQQAQFDAQRGAPASPAMAARAMNPLLALRDEMGDAEFERYLAALGRPTSLGVTNVLANSSAATGGVRPGDEIVSYNGKRIFSSMELNALAMETPPGTSVTMEVRRNGQPMQVVVPAGPVGISSDLIREVMGDRYTGTLPPAIR